MEADDMIVLVVVEDDEEKSRKTNQLESKTEPEYITEDSQDIDTLIEAAEKHGEYIPVNVEPSENFDYDYLEDDQLKQEMKSEQSDDDQDGVDSQHKEYTFVSDCNELVERKLSAHRDPGKHRLTMLKPYEQRSFIAELRQEYAELRDDEELLIDILKEIMKSVKPPPPPRGYYIMTGIMFECVICGSLTVTVPAATRHYHEKHGPRYLVCYACGVDFRSTGNLYKHEKRCVAPDASIVLRARAAFLGRKGRSRPYIRKDPSTKVERVRFPCQLCSAVFMTQRNLQSHENLHRGERPFRCHECPCAYTSYSALARHALKHRDVEFICDYCGRSFKVKAALVSHMDTHKPVRKHGCTECSRRFAQKSALKLHINRVHRNLPHPCACQICPKRFPRMTLLKAHMKREHGMSIITRKMFFKYLPTMDELEIKKQSKIILKSENDILKYGTNPLDTNERFKQSLKAQMECESENRQSSGFCDIETPQDTDLIMDGLMEYATGSNQNLGTNVIYIENGEIVQRIVVDESQDNVTLQVEAMVDGSQIFLESLTDNSVRTKVRSDN